MDANLGAVEHLDAQNVEGIRRAGADDLSEGGDADAHQLAAGALLGLLAAQLGVADLVHRLLERGGIVAAVVFPAGGGLVGELLRLDEVLHAELGRVHVQLAAPGCRPSVRWCAPPRSRGRNSDRRRRRAACSCRRRPLRRGRFRDVVGAGADARTDLPGTSTDWRRRRTRRGRRWFENAAPCMLPSLSAASSAVMW